MIAFSSTSSIGMEARCTRLRIGSGTACHRARHSASTSAPSGSSVTPDTSGPTSMRWASPGPSAAILTNPSSTPAMSLSRSQRLTCTMRRASCGGGGAVGDQAGVVPDRARRAVASLEAARAVRAPRRRPVRRSPGSRRPSPGRAAVLGRERVDRRRDDDDPLPVDPVRHVLPPGEHERVGVFDVRPEERPRLVGLGVAGVAPDMATPHDADAVCARGRRPCRRSGGRGAARSRASRSGRPSRRRSRRRPVRMRRAQRCRVVRRRPDHRAAGCAAAS